MPRNRRRRSFGPAEMPHSYARVNVADAWVSQGRGLRIGWPRRVCDGIERRKLLPEPSARISASGLEAAPHRRRPIAIDLSVKHPSEKIGSEYRAIVRRRESLPCHRRYNRAVGSLARSGEAISAAAAGSALAALVTSSSATVGPTVPATTAVAPIPVVPTPTTTEELCHRVASANLTNNGATLRGVVPRTDTRRQGFADA